MSELGDVLAAIESLSARGERLALATIVAVRGSTYRRPGARLLVPEEGAPIGNLSGGCLEGDVADAARLVMREGTARLASWDLTADDDAVWGLGLGCNGAIEVFIEPADRAAEVAEALRLALEAERPICLVTVVDSNTGDIPPGARLLVHPDGDVEGSLGRDDVDAAAVAAARELFAAGRSEVRHLADVVRAFVEILEPPLRLLVCGAGHDAIPVVRAAAGVGWRAVVVDDRPELLTHERFPEAAGFAPVVEPGAIASAARIDERTCAVVMTHNFLRDKGYLRALLATPVAYIGMLGPSARTRRILHELESEGVRPSERDLHRIHGPAGLDLGAEGPEEIAQAIVAEILAFRRGRGGGFLKLRPGPIHDRPRPGAEAGAPARRSR
ncbi:MAG: xanthine dehydrogenase accessory factor [Actinomycetota bacterium]|jgi:xanthine/CO dehydrogenase XdhC/CoxF family maturation factor|nr:MAG: xanthine dehydrogenase accessory factor [Actinomycetota bacterium]